MTTRLHLPIILAIGFSVLTSCSPPPDPPANLPRPVFTITVEPPVTEIERAFSGLVESAEGVGIAFEVGGRVVEVIAEDGVRYEEGALLARIDDTEYRNQLIGSEAQLTEAQQNFRRTQQLFETGNAAQGALETAIAREKAARSNFNSAQKRVEDSRLTMPYDGVIGEVSIDPQQVVSTGQLAMTIQGEAGLEFQIGVPAEIVARVKPRQPATIELGTLPGQIFSATVQTVSPQPGANTTYPVTLKFAQTDARIREGMDGEAILNLPNPNGSLLTIPAVCVSAEPGDSTFVWVFESAGGDTGTVKKREVETGRLRSGAELEIITGLETGDIVVSRGISRLREGQTVRLAEQ